MLSPIAELRRIRAIGAHLVRRPRWIRHAWRWHQSLLPGREPLIDASPWVTFDCQAWLERWLAPTMRVFEWGSGGSTLFVACRVRQLVTIEHDAQWAARVRARLDADPSAHARCQYRVVPPQHDDERTRVARGADAPHAALDYRSSGEAWADHVFEDYASAIDAQPDASFDLVIVDGRARNACVVHALPKVLRGGFLLLDNADRVEYQPSIERLAAWPGMRFAGPGPYNTYPWETRIWRRP